MGVSERGARRVASHPRRRTDLLHSPQRAQSPAVRALPAQHNRRPQRRPGGGDRAAPVRGGAVPGRAGGMVALRRLGRSLPVGRDGGRPARPRRRAIRRAIRRRVRRSRLPVRAARQALRRRPPEPVAAAAKPRRGAADLRSVGRRRLPARRPRRAWAAVDHPGRARVRAPRHVRRASARPGERDDRRRGRRPVRTGRRHAARQDLPVRRRGHRRLPSRHGHRRHPLRTVLRAHREQRRLPARTALLHGIREQRAEVRDVPQRPGFGERGLQGGDRAATVRRGAVRRRAEGVVALRRRFGPLPLRSGERRPAGPRRCQVRRRVGRSRLPRGPTRQALPRRPAEPLGAETVARRGRAGRAGARVDPLAGRHRRRDSGRGDPAEHAALRRRQKRRRRRRGRADRGRGGVQGEQRWARVARRGAADDQGHAV